MLKELRIKNYGLRIVFRRVRRRRARKTSAKSKADFLVHKNTARKLVEEKIVKWNAVYNFKYNKIVIRNQKTRWGSCSKKGNLNFNYKIALLPEYLAEYIVVHELCHLGEFNHSKRFWELVAKAVPNFREYRKQLRKVGSSNKVLELGDVV